MIDNHDNEKIKGIFKSVKTIAMIGVSNTEKDKKSSTTRRRPSVIVMKYLQEFGYKVIPVNPSAAGKKILGETFVSSLNDIKIPIDLVNVFRPSNEAEKIAYDSIIVKPKVLWLQYGISSEKAKKVAEDANIIYIANKCIKQEYQRLFLKMSPVFPVLQ